MKYLILILAITLTGCIPDPEVPTSATCTADGWRVDVQTGEIITNDTGSAIQCDFN